MGVSGVFGPEDEGGAVPFLGEEDRFLWREMEMRKSVEYGEW